MVGLTVPWVERCEKAYQGKKLKYQDMADDIRSKGWNALVFPSGFRCRGLPAQSTWRKYISDKFNLFINLYFHYNVVLIIKKIFLRKIYNKYIYIIMFNKIIMCAVNFKREDEIKIFPLTSDT